MYEKAMLCGWIGGFLPPAVIWYSYIHGCTASGGAVPLAIARLAFEPGGLAADDQIISSLCNSQSEEP